ncbi:MAG: alpha/beta fold hydrolase [Dokdonella sp.]
MPRTVDGERVILLHGIWMSGFTMSSLAGRLREAGFRTENFEYASVQGGAENAADALRERMLGYGGETVHLLGHSLGGLVALHAVDRDEPLPPGRVVCIGSPLLGSAAVRGLEGHTGLHWMLGGSRKLLQAGFERWSGKREVGVVAGTKGIGLGGLFGALEAPHDGTVSVSETCLPGVSDHVCLPVSHTGMVFSTPVANMAIGFLRDGHFPSVDRQTG